jgi:hypothetical protein
MRNRHAWLVVVALMLPSRAYAHGHTWDGSGGPIVTGGGSVLAGVYFGLGVTLQNMVDNDLALVGDVANLKGKHDDEELTQLSYTGGLRWAVNGRNADNRKHIVIVHALMGIMNRHLGADDKTHFTSTLGGAYEFTPRAAPQGWGVRVQVDRQFTNDIKDTWRFSTGFVRRF